MGAEESKTEYQKLEEKLTYSSKNIWEEEGKERVKKVFAYGENYKDFLNNAKSERLTVKWVLGKAKEKGYKNLYDTSEMGPDDSTPDDLGPGDCFYALNRGKNIALVKIGEEAIEDGINIVAAHADAPRLDLKQNPLIEDIEIALLKTHYYGGVKKYQWLNIPLAITGVVITKDNKKVEIEIGFKDSDPVFVIPDLLPHLAQKVQSEKKAKEFIQGESLNLVAGNIPVKDKKVKEKVKLAVLEKLNKDYGILEEDFISAELEAVPAARPRDVGIDRSMIGGYGHDDRVCVFAAVTSIFDSKPAKKTTIAFIVDKEEIGSDGPTGAKSQFIFTFVGAILKKLNKKTGEYSDMLLRETMERSVCISADVSAALNPMYKEVHDEKNASRLSHGVVLTKYTGAGGKYAANDADAELVGMIRYIFNKNGIYWQYGGMGKVDEGGGGTIAKHLAFYNTSVIDCGVPVIGMHSPYELISKADLYYAYLAYKVFFEKA